MKRMYGFVTWFLFFSILLLPSSITAQAIEESENPFAIISISDETEEKIFRFNAYYTENGQIGVGIEPVKEEIFTRGELYLAATEPNSKTPLYDGFLPESMYRSALQGVCLGTDYNVFLKQRIDDTEYLYYGTFSVSDEDGALGCTSFLYEDTQQAMDSLSEYLIQGDDGVSAVNNGIATYDTTYRESEPNNDWDEANGLSSGDTYIGYLSTSSDVDWYAVTFYEPGKANFWLGEIPSGCNYDLQVYEVVNNSKNLLWSSTGTTGQELIGSKEIVPFKRYYMKVYKATSKFDASSAYKVAARLYPSGATTPTFSYKLKSGISTIKYVVMDSIYATEINNAFYNWRGLNFGGSGISTISRISDSSKYETAQLFFYDSVTASGGVRGVTQHYNSFFDMKNNGSNIDPNSENWTYVRIDLCTDLLGTNSVYTDPAGASAVAAHEIGHALGLKHANSNVYSIMCQVGSGRKTYQPSKTDATAVKSKY